MIESFWLVLRAAGLMLSFQAAGAALFRVLFARELSVAAPAIGQLGSRIGFAAVLVVSVQVLFEPVYLAGQWSGALDPDTLRLFLGSSTAAALALRLLGTVAIGLGLRRCRPGFAGVAVAGCLAVLISFTLSGHTSVRAHRAALAALLLLHLGIVAFWFGALWPLRQVMALEPCVLAARVIAAFSQLAVRLVPGIAVAGACLAVLLLPDLAALTQPYGLVLLGKVALFTLLMGLAALNRLRLAPAFAAGRGQGALRHSIALEYGLICATLALTALMSGKFSPEP
jgi:putative copper resistance protein D